jgi:integrase
MRQRDRRRERGVYEKVSGLGVWWIRYVDAAGRLRREKAGTKSAAVDLYRKRKQQALEGIKLPEKLRNLARPTLREFSKRFLQAIEIRCAAKPRTVKFYAEQVKRLLEFEPLASARLSDIDESLVESYVQHRSKDFIRRRTKEGWETLAERNVSPATVNRGLATLRRLMRLAQEWRVIDRVPRIRLIAGERNREFVLNYPEEKIYLEFAPQPLSEIALLILDTGLRLGEALGLEWGDVHLTPNGSQWGYVEVREGKSRSARRAVPLTRRAHRMLSERRRVSQMPFVFADPEGNVPRVSSVDHVHSRTRKELKFSTEFVLHSLRHTYLTRLGLAGADAFTIMKLAGHSSVTVSQRYVHPTPRAMQDAVARLDNMNARSLESKSMRSAQRVRSGSADQRAEVLGKPTDTRTDTATPSVPVSH